VNAKSQGTEAYWRERCTAAEAALAKARTAITMTKGRLAVLNALGDLRQDEWLDTERLGAVLGLRADKAFMTLAHMEAFGLVERLPGRRGTGGVPSRWRLGHMVQVESEPTETEAEVCE
jgi:hypothetical protein